MLRRPTSLSERSESVSTCLNNSARSHCKEWWKLTHPSRTSNCMTEYNEPPNLTSWKTMGLNFVLSSLSSESVTDIRMLCVTVAMAATSSAGVAY